jgi:hypothetical protein
VYVRMRPGGIDESFHCKSAQYQAKSGYGQVLMDFVKHEMECALLQKGLTAPEYNQAFAVNCRFFIAPV